MTINRESPLPQSLALGSSIIDAAVPIVVSTSNPMPKPAGPPSGTSSNNSSKPLYFFREAHATTGYLSQWYTSTSFFDPTDPMTKVYRSAEHYMMHHKALLFNDHETASLILTDAIHPRRAKDLGRTVSGFDMQKWLENRERIVRRGNWCKFTYPLTGEAQSGFEHDGPSHNKWKLGVGPHAKESSATKSFRDILLMTGTHELVEASPFDRIWGIGYKAADAEWNRENWGENLLGKALMEVREEFRKEEVEKARLGGC